MTMISVLYEEVSLEEATNRGAMAEPALSEADALASLDAPQEEDTDDGL